MGSMPFWSDFLSNISLVVKGVDLEEVTKFIFAFKMFGIPRLGMFSLRQNSGVKEFVPGYEFIGSRLWNIVIIIEIDLYGHH